MKIIDEQAVKSVAAKAPETVKVTESEEFIQALPLWLSVHRDRWLLLRVPANLEECQPDGADSGRC